MSDNESVDLAPLTDDKQASNTSRNSTVPAQHLHNRYNFVYPAFPPGSKVPRFKDHPFWRALYSSDGCALAKLTVIIRHPKFDFDRQTALAILAAGLPSFRLAVSTLDPQVPVPTDITVALSGVYHLIANNTDTASEWQYFPFPPSESIPACAPGFSPPHATTAAEGPTREQSAPGCFSSPKPATAKKKKSKPQQAKSASVGPSDDSGEDGPLSKRRKTAGKGNQDVSESPGLHDPSALRRSKRSEATAPKSPSGKVPAAVQAKIDAMIPIIRTKLAEMLVERTKSGSETHYTITLSAFQGHRTYVPNNTFGPAPPPKKKGELPKEPLVDLVRFSAIDYEQVLQPPGACLLCLMYGITCNPMVFGLACTHCNQKKMHTLCDHTWRADKVREVMGGIEELRGIMFPDAPIVPNMIPHLMEQVSTARDLYSSLRNDLTDAFRAFFTSVCNNVTINTLIHAFNHYNDPKTAHLPLKPKVTLKVKESAEEEKEDGGMDEDAEGEVDATVEREPESSKSSPRKKRKRSPSE
ncbi:hypothetical protein B0H14DRAFT_3464086 [Mycena olivaceomarginata]|nr:hypothetical protein B0H14DRAFT_3464086 [Mycena olivaceomarginata]